MTINFMLDIETLGTKPDAAIVQMAIVAFDRETFEPKDSGICVNVDPDLNKYSVDMDTIRFWMNQNEEARSSVFIDAYYVRVGLSEISDYYYIHTRDIDTPIWSMPPSFDQVILGNAFRTEGVKIPWHYRSPRDMRTIIDLAGLKKEEIVKADISHNALSDCHAQIKTLKKCFDIISNSA